MTSFSRRSFSALALIAAACAATAQVERPVRLGEKLPPLELDYIKGDKIIAPNGKNITLVEFWATWCKPCLKTIPHLTAIQKRFEDRGLQVIGISDESRDLVDAFVHEMGAKMDYSVAVDVNRKTSNRFRENDSPIPRAFLFNEEGTLIWIGHPADENLERLIDEVTSELQEGS